MTDTQKGPNAPGHVILPTALDSLTTNVKCEILADMAAGIVPLRVRSYSQLHDYVDANMYGEPIWSIYSDQHGHDATLDLLNAMQERVNLWLEKRLPGLEDPARTDDLFTELTAAAPCPICNRPLRLSWEFVNFHRERFPGITNSQLRGLIHTCDECRGLPTQPGQYAPDGPRTEPVGWEVQRQEQAAVEQDATCPVCKKPAHFVGLIMLAGLEQDAARGTEAWRWDCPDGHTLLGVYTAEIEEEEVGEYFPCCGAPTDMGHMDGCPNNPERGQE